MKITFKTDIADAKRIETIGVLAAACLVFGLLFQAAWLHYAALVLLLLGLFFRKTSRWIAAGWLVFAELLGKVVSPALLGAVFYVVLTPLAWLARKTGRTPLHLRKEPPGSTSYYTERNHDYTPADFDRAH